MLSLHIVPLLLFTTSNQAQAKAEPSSFISTPLSYLRRRFGYEDGSQTSEESGLTVNRQDQQPRLRKMSDDEDEKFWPHYWGPLVSPDQGQYSVSLADDFNVSYAQHDTDLGEAARDANFSSQSCAFSTPFALHEEGGPARPEERWERSRRSWGRLFARQATGFTCPAGSTSCSNIGRATSCCSSGSSCYIVTDTGLGDVGCCPPGSHCSGSIRDCLNGFTSCNTDIGGGCCVPGYSCVAQGCVPGNSVVSVYVQATSSTTAQASSASSTAIVIPPLVTGGSTRTTYTTVIAVSTSTIIPSSTSTTPSSTSSSSSTETSTSSSTTSTDTTTTTTVPSDSTSASDTIAPLAPFRGTSGAFSSTTTVTTSSLIGSICPTGFYACSAVYQGGCCRTGRDCATTNCPTSSTVQLVTYNGLTIGVPAGAAATTAAAQGNCATGWSSCPASASGGCCPSGYSCGTASCDPTISAAGTAEVAKVAANLGSSLSKPTRLPLFIVVIFALLYLLR